jgi:hypothetical protein
MLGQALVDKCAGSDLTPQVPFRVQLLEGGYGCSARDAILTRKIARRRQPGSGTETAVQNGTPQLFVQPASEGYVRGAFVQCEIQRTDGFRHPLLSAIGEWSKIYAQYGSTQCTK